MESYEAILGAAGGVYLFLAAAVAFFARHRGLDAAEYLVIGVLLTPVVSLALVMARSNRSTSSAEASLRSAEAEGGQVPGPSNCINCGTALFAQWWSEGMGGYECRRCGALTAGVAPKQGDSMAAVLLAYLLVVIALSVGTVSLLPLIGRGVGLTNASLPWLTFAIASGVAAYGVGRDRKWGWVLCAIVGALMIGFALALLPEDPMAWAIFAVVAPTGAVLVVGGIVRSRRGWRNPIA